MNGQRTKYWIEYRKRRSKAVVHADRCSESATTEGAREYSTLKYAMYDAVIASRIEVHTCCPKNPGLWLWAWRVKNEVLELRLRWDRVSDVEGNGLCDSCCHVAKIVCSVLINESKRVSLCRYCREKLLLENAVTVVSDSGTKYIEVSGGRPGSNRRH